MISHAPIFPADVAGLVNALAVRWMGLMPKGKDTVFSPAGVWPLLAMLAGATKEGAVERADLEEVVGVDANQGVELAVLLIEWLHRGSKGREYLDLKDYDHLADNRTVHAALGVWLMDGARTDTAYTDQLPPGTINHLTGDLVTDANAIKAWTKEQTDGLLPNIKISLDKTTRAVIASAIILKTSWQSKFSKSFYSDETGLYSPLLRTSVGADIIRTSKDLTVVQIKGRFGVHVYLVLGREGESESSVLKAGLAAIAGGVKPLKYDQSLPPSRLGPGLRFHYTIEKSNHKPDTEVHLAVPPFSLTAEHDLLAHAETFGLSHCFANDGPKRNAFPALSLDEPIGISDFKQEAMAEFAYNGFSAAAVSRATGVPRRAAKQMPTPRKALHLTVIFDRPFGFIAMYDDPHAVLFAGWVADGFDKYDWTPWATKPRFKSSADSGE